MLYAVLKSSENRLRQLSFIHNPKPDFQQFLEYSKKQIFREHDLEQFETPASRAYSGELWVICKEKQDVLSPFLAGVNIKQD